MGTDEITLKKVREYAEAKRQLACLSLQIEEIGKGLVALGTALLETPDSVRPLADDIQLSRQLAVAAEDALLYTSDSVSREILDAEALDALLQEYREAQDNKGRLEQVLISVGLGELIS